MGRWSAAAPLPTDFVQRLLGEPFESSAETRCAPCAASSFWSFRLPGGRDDEPVPVRDGALIYQSWNQKSVSTLVRIHRGVDLTALTAVLHPLFRLPMAYRIRKRRSGEEEAKIVLGGCIVRDPRWHCRDCETDWPEDI